MSQRLNEICVYFFEWGQKLPPKENVQTLFHPMTADNKGIVSAITNIWIFKKRSHRFCTLHMDLSIFGSTIKLKWLTSKSHCNNKQQEGSSGEQTQCWPSLSFHIWQPLRRDLKGFKMCPDHMTPRSYSRSVNVTLKKRYSSVNETEYVQFNLLHSWILICSFCSLK